MATDKLFFRSRHGGSCCGRIFLKFKEKRRWCVSERFQFLFRHKGRRSQKADVCGIWRAPIGMRPPPPSRSIYRSGNGGSCNDSSRHFCVAVCQSLNFGCKEMMKSAYNSIEFIHWWASSSSLSTRKSMLSGRVKRNSGWGGSNAILMSKLVGWRADRLRRYTADSMKIIGFLSAWRCDSIGAACWS